MSPRFAHGRDSRAGALRVPRLAATSQAASSCGDISCQALTLLWKPELCTHVELQNRRRDVGMLGMRSPVCWRPSSSLFEHGKHILYVTLIINKTLTSYTQLFFSYDNAWYNVFHEHFYLKLPLSCETKQFKMDCLNFLKNKHCKFFFKDTFTKCNQRWISDPNVSQTQGIWQNYKCENDVEWDIKLESEVEDKLGCHAGGSAAFLLQWVSLVCSQFLLECLFLNANLFQYDWCIREKAIWA